MINNYMLYKYEQKTALKMYSEITIHKHNLILYKKNRLNKVSMLRD